MPKFRDLLARMTSPGILMEKDMQDLASLCAERSKPGVWSNRLIYLMGMTHMALDNNDRDCRDWMVELRAGLDLEYPPA
ncbi:hypothetical protein ASE08_15510 [Rhizobacter sp. Root16D2]|nr:hypothetical protein ASC88_01145 [Rhizobacter sp. Root29]KQW12153.1 hypothetical protein ASC98_20425 [Rhizobacter sp. Root1238]KRB02968.1 hypothetical protein ASE08_15510 [Rhizobacter sp. Root16D2]